MKASLPSLLALALLAPAAAAAQPPATVFGVYDPDSFAQGNATRFVGCHNGERFVVGACALAEPGGAGTELPALDAAGRPGAVRIASVLEKDGDLYEAPYDATAALPGGDPVSVPMLFWSPGPAIQVITPRPIALDPVLRDTLRARAADLLERANAARTRDERPDSVVLGEPQVVELEGERRIVVYWPAALAYGADRDERASFFFVYGTDVSRVVHASFGHPEWAPVDDEIVLEIQPLLYFRVGNDRRVYLFGRRSLAWEHTGFGIFDVRTGLTLLKSF
ncbi:MAG TPA: hypothetical protein VFQ45_18685 [Longimicrobium sp.]|nr:hypothetical protein [Longimicrobium sp.]